MTDEGKTPPPPIGAWKPEHRTVTLTEYDEHGVAVEVEQQEVFDVELGGWVPYDKTEKKVVGGVTFTAYYVFERTGTVDVPTPPGGPYSTREQARDWCLAVVDAATPPDGGT